MTRGSEEVDAALRLAHQGLSATAVANRIGVPRTTVRDWMAGRVPARPNGETCPQCAGSAHSPADLPALYVYLLGLYLGDGYVALHRRGVGKLRITLDARYPGIIEEAVCAMRSVRPFNRVGRIRRKGDVELYGYSKAWPCLLPQHGAGKKHQRPIVLEEWQKPLVQARPDLLIRGLIHSDGCRSMNTGTNWRHPRYSFSNRSVDIQRIFCFACDELGLHWTTTKWTVYVSRKADVATMDRFVGPKR